MLGSGVYEGKSARFGGGEPHKRAVAQEVMVFTICWIYSNRIWDLDSEVGLGDFL